MIKKMQKRRLLYACCATLLFSPAGVYAAENDADKDVDYTLEQTVVSATRTEKSIKEVTSSVSVITQEMIKNSNAKSVTELLVAVPGVAVNGRGSLGNPGSISMRGLNGGQGSGKVQVLMDGRPVNMGFSGSVDWNLIPMEIIERIEVVRGPASALYGGNGLSGTINIITKKPDGEERTFFDSSYGTYNTSVTSFVKQGRSGSTNYMITGSYGKSDGFVPHSEYEGKNITVRLDFDKDWILRSGYNEYERTNYGLKAATYPLGYDTTDSTAYYFDLEKKFKSDMHETSIRTYYNYGNPVETLSNGKKYANWKNRLQGLMLQQDIKLAEKHTLTWGGEYQKASADDVEDLKASNIKNYSYDTYSFFVQDDRKLSEKWLMNLGGRYDHNSAYGGQFSPKIGFAYNLSGDTVLKLNVAKAFKAPSLSDINSNPNLRPTTEWSYELGIDKQFNEKTKGSIVFYKMDTQDNIIKGSNVTATNANMHPQGVEMSFERKIDDHLDFYLNYTYLDDGDLTFYASRHKASGGINYVNKNFRINLSQSYVGSTWDGDAINTSGSNIGKPASRNLLDSYLLTNIKFSYQLKENYKVSLGIENLFDRKYVNWQNLPMPGRTVTCSISRKF